MRLIILLVGILNFITYSTYAQLHCGTESTQNSHYIREPLNSFSSNELEGVSFCVNVYFHVIRNSIGQTSIPVYYPFEILEKLNDDFAPHKISFQSIGTGYINNTIFSRDGVGIYDGNAEQLFSTNHHSNAIDIYIAEKADWFGKANGILSTDLIIHKDYALSGVVSHEMGHCLNLYHTHELMFGLEFPDGSNCHVSGDLVCDTPADPNLANYRHLLTNCLLPNNSITSPNQIIYYPDSKNLMSYTAPDCMQHFSLDQELRMKDAMYNSTILQNVLTCCRNIPITFLPSSEVCFFDTQTFYLDNICYNTKTTWQVSNNVQIEGQDNFSISVKATNSSVSGSGWIKATFNNSSQQIIQNIQVGVPNYYIQSGYIESQFVDIYYQRWTRLFLHGVSELSGWEWQVNYSDIRPSTNREILIYPKVLGTIYARVRRENQCGKGPWLTKYFTVIQQDEYKVLKPL